MKQMWKAFKTSVTLTISKASIKMLRFAKLGGTTLPGKIATFLMPDILCILSSNLKRIIIVTGTNGKTTTCRIVGNLLSHAEIPYFTNKSGANLKSGVLSTLIENCNLSAGFKIDTALLEVDEAAFPLVTEHVSPNFIIITNFFRDQLDRYGELYTTVKNVQLGIEKTSNPTLIVNSDESLSSSIAKNTGKNCIYFGIDSNAFANCDSAANNSSTNSDATFCIYCKSKYVYNFHTFGHLGGFKCPSCGFERISPDVYCLSIDKLTSSNSEVTIAFNTLIGTSDLSEENIPTNNDTAELRACSINLPGLYNIYNALAAATLGHAMQIPAEKIVHAIETFECGFGRMETIATNGKFIKLILVKNPTGFNQVIDFLLTEERESAVTFAINDNLADGTDISWLWDVDFEKLVDFQNKASCFLTAGKRADDMAVRLKYAGIDASSITTCSDYEQLIDTGLSKTPVGNTFYIMPTYTALLEIRNILAKKFHLKEFWK